MKRILLFSILAFLLGRLSCTFEMRKQNTNTIKLCGIVAESLYHNSDLMARFSHYTENHQEIHTFCPECFVASDKLVGSSYSIIPPEEIEYEHCTPDASLYDDALEILQNLQRIQHSLGTQKICLSYTLQSLRKDRGKAE